MDKYYFQLCPKIVLFSKDKKKVLLCKRSGESDYNAFFSFIGGKIEKTDKDLLSGIKREKDEEVGEKVKIKIGIKYSVDVLFDKKDGTRMFIPHYYAIYESGEIELSQEYSEYKWIEIDKLSFFEPKIPTIPEIVRRIILFSGFFEKDDFVKI